MKNSWEWDEDDLLELVRTGTQESVELDFKVSSSLQLSDSKKRDISKDVSAFANSAGGTLVYGIDEDKHTHVATAIDAGSDPKEISKEWLEQVINSTIHQRIDGVRVQQILLAKTSPGRVAYVVYVPFSTRTAHQAIDKKFYKRFNFQSVPMEEYEVRDLYRRRDTPDLRIEFGLENERLDINQSTTEYEPFSLLAAITNDAIEPANYAIIKVFIDARLSIESTGGLEKHDGIAFLYIANVQHPVSQLNINWGIPGKMPIFNEARFSLPDNPFRLKMASKGSLKEDVYLLGYEIKSPRMAMKQAFTLLKRTDDTISLSGQYLNGIELSANYHELGF